MSDLFKVLGVCSGSSPQTALQFVLPVRTSRQKLQRQTSVNLATNVEYKHDSCLIETERIHMKKR